MPTGLGHYFIWDGDEGSGMFICSGCDCYRGSEASMKPCPAYESSEELIPCTPVPCPPEVVTVRDTGQIVEEPCPHCDPAEL